jgi:hypothetical protein
MKRRHRHHATEFAAPWGRSVKLASGLVGLIALGITLVPFAAEAASPGQARWAWLMPVVVVLIFGITSLFAVRGYRLTPHELWVRRLLWWTRLSLRDLRAAEVDPEAMKGALRTAGNGGYLALTGWFWSRRLGHFRALVTDPQRGVVLRFKEKLLVVSPEDPDAFVQALGCTSSAERKP